MAARLGNEGADAQIVLDGQFRKQRRFSGLGDALLDHAMRRKAAD